MNDYEFQLRQGQESLEFALQSGKMGTWDINLETGSIICSKEMLDIWNVNEHEFNGDRSMLQNKVHPEDRALMIEKIDKAIAAKNIYELEYRIYPSPGSMKWVMSRGRCTFPPGSDRPIRVAGIVFDITEKKLKEEALAAAVKARDQFYMVASHELKTPLTCLQLQLQVINWELKHNFPEIMKNDRIDSGLQKQQEHLLRISRIVDNILDEAKISHRKLSLAREKFNLYEMIAEVLAKFKVTSEAAGVEISFPSSQNVIVSWDRFRMEQVILNLLMNSIRYGNRRPVEIAVAADNKEVRVMVRDQGIGIRPEDHDRIFERFERVRPDIEANGMGLGLYISKSIVQEHGGEIRVRSQINEGAEFTVCLPQE